MALVAPGGGLVPVVAILGAYASIDFFESVLREDDPDRYQPGFATVGLVFIALGLVALASSRQIEAYDSLVRTVAIGLAGTGEALFESAHRVAR